MSSQVSMLGVNIGMLINNILAICIYLDILNLFLYILKIVGKKK